MLCEFVCVVCVLCRGHRRERCGSMFTLITLGMGVGWAREKYAETARKNDDADAEDRFSYPTLYAEGPSIEAKAFNCVQRGHY